MKRVRSFRSKNPLVPDGAAPPYIFALARDIQTLLDAKQDATNFGPFTYKSDIINRMTEDQVNDFGTLLSQTTTRMRLTWDAIQAVYHLSDFFPEFYGMFVDEFGQAEADRILAVSGRA